MLDVLPGRLLKPISIAVEVRLTCQTALAYRVKPNRILARADCVHSAWPGKKPVSRCRCAVGAGGPRGTGLCTRAWPTRPRVRESARAVVRCWCFRYFECSQLRTLETLVFAPSASASATLWVVPSTVPLAIAGGGEPSLRRSALPSSAVPVTWCPDILDEPDNRHRPRKGSNGARLLRGRTGRAGL